MDRNHIKIASYLLTCWALADKAADLVQTFTLVQTGGAETLIHIYLTVSSIKSCMNGEKEVLIISVILNARSDILHRYCIISEEELYQACRCMCSLQCDPNKCHRSDMGLKRTHLHLAHTVAQRNPSHSYRWRSRQCLHTDHHAHKGWYLWMKKNKLEAWTEHIHMLCIYKCIKTEAFFLTDAAFISIGVASAAYISRGTVTVEHATDGIGVTMWTLSAGVTDTGIISMAE